MRRFVFSVFLAVLGAGILVSAQTTSALSSDPKHFISGDNTFYAYVKAGEKLSASFTRAPHNAPQALHAKPENITVTVDGPGIKQEKCVLKKTIAVGSGCSFAKRSSQVTGIWRVQLEAPESAVTFEHGSQDIKWGSHYYEWNVTVTSNNGEEKGRIWTERYAFRQPPGNAYSGDFATFYVSEDGYIYKAINYDFNGQVAELLADGIGVRKGEECISAYRSISVTDEEYSPALGACGNQYKLFFEEPSGSLPADAIRWDETRDWVRPSIKKPTVSELHFVPDDTNDQLSGDITFYLRNFIGQYQIKIDVDNDGSFDGQNDVVLLEQMKELSSGLQRVHFQGVDKKGQIIFPSQTIGVKVEITKVAEIHFIASDVEGRGGIELVRLNGENAPASRVCWDDTSFEQDSPVNSMTSVIDGRDCPDSSGGVHGWDFVGGSWGDRRFIDDWIYATAKLEGNNMITFPEGETQAELNGRQNWMPILAGAAGVGIIIIGAIIAFVMFRKSKNNNSNGGPNPPSQPPTQQPPVPPQNTGGTTPPSATPS